MKATFKWLFLCSSSVTGCIFRINLLKFFCVTMAINIHPLAKKIAILVIVKVTVLWIFFKIIPIEKIRLNTTKIENHFFTKN